MLYLIFKAAVSGVIIALASEIARRAPVVGALILSLPLMSLLAVVWLWRDTRDVERVATHVEATFWYVLPSLPLFLVLPVLLRRGIGLWPALAASIVMTIGLYLGMAWLLARGGVKLR